MQPFREDLDLPNGRSPEVHADDLVPQFGYVGAHYPKLRILFLGINPGNGPPYHRSDPDARMIPALRRFAEEPSDKNFLDASRAYQAECQLWSIWRHCRKILSSAALTADDIAYANCLPWRTQSKSGFSDAVASRTVELYVAPLIKELEPRLIMATAMRAHEIIESVLGLPETIVWNRAQAETDSVLEERRRR